MVLYRNRFYVESADENLLHKLQRDPVIRKAKANESTELARSAALKEHVCVCGGGMMWWVISVCGYSGWGAALKAHVCVFLYYFVCNCIVWAGEGVSG